MPDAWPAPGCTTIPAGLLSTAMSGVLVQDVERQRLAARVAALGVGHVTSTRSPSRTMGFGLGRRTAAYAPPSRAARTVHVAVGNQLLDLRAGMVGEHRHQKAIEPLAVDSAGTRMSGIKGDHSAHAGYRTRVGVPAWSRSAMPHRDRSTAYAHHSGQAATRFRRALPAGLRVPATARTASARLSGARTSEMNCEVENPNTMPRGSPR